jgi:hypothetical protein
MTSSKVKAGSKLFPVDPVAVTSGAVSSWFSLAHPSSVITGSGYSSVHDILDPSSPATQSTDARRPPAATSTNGLPIITVATHALVIPVTAARYGTTKWGFWGWFRRGTDAFHVCSADTTPGSSVARHHIRFFAANFRFSAFNADSSQQRDCDLPVPGTLGLWRFFTIEYNSDFAGDAALCMTVNGAPVTPTFSGALGAIPSSLRSITGDTTFAAFSSAGDSPYVGSVGSNWGFFGSAMPGVTTGLLTPNARLALMNYQRPT